ncbi:MAG: ATP-binding protein [Caldilineaceae bacterium]|nr:ATP-binding protein [Caldilineaceae bacterium]
MQHFQLTLAADLNAVPRFRDFVLTTLDRAGLNQRVQVDLTVAVAEACRIIALYAYANLEPGSIELDIGVGQREVRLELTDFGHPLVPVNPDESEENAVALADAAALADEEKRAHARALNRPIALPPIFCQLTHFGYQPSRDGNHLLLVQQLDAGKADGEGESVGELP